MFLTTLVSNFGKVDYWHYLVLLALSALSALSVLITVILKLKKSIIQ